MQATKRRSTRGVPAVRPLRPDDAGVLAVLSERLGSGETAAAWSTLLARTESGPAVAIGLEVDGHVVGYATGVVRSAFGLGRPSAWIESCAIDLAWRGQGLGRALVEALLVRFRELGAARVYTMAALHDRTMAPFLREMGFREQPMECLGRAL